MQILQYITLFFKGMPSFKFHTLKIRGDNLSVLIHTVAYLFYVYVKGAPNCAQGLHFKRYESRELNRRPRHFWGLKIFLK